MEDGRRVPRLWLWVGALLCVQAALLGTSIVGKGLTYDEPFHLQYGVAIAHGQAGRLPGDDSKMPVSVLNAVPGLLWARIVGGERAAVEAVGLALGRVVTMLITLGVGVLVFAWSRRLYGDAGGLLSLGLYALAPNIIAHGRLITTELPSIGAILLTLFLFQRFLRTPSWRWLLATGAALGLAQVTKYTALLLYGLLPVMALVYWYPQLRALGRDRERWRRAAKRTAAFGAAALGLSLLIINIGFLFTGTGTSLQGYDLQSRELQALADSPLGRVPLPLPVPFVAGIDRIRHYEATGKNYGDIYLWGELRQTDPGYRPFFAYYLRVGMFKVPLATLALFVAALVLLVRRRDWAGLRERELVPLLALAGFGLYFNVLHRAQIGFRHALVLVPLMHVLCGRLLAPGQAVPRPARLVLGGALTALAVTVVSWYPHYLPYCNELVPNRLAIWRVMADANVDWGQDGPAVRRWLREHPAAAFAPPLPITGTVVVSVNQLVGVTTPRERFAWLRRLRPVDHIGYSHLVYRVEPADLPSPP